MLRVPGTWNTHKNAPVRLIHYVEPTTIAGIRKGLSYVRERTLKSEKVVPPDLSELLQEYKEFLKFSEAIDKTIAETEPKPKRKVRKARPVVSNLENSEKAQARLKKAKTRILGESSEIIVPDDRRKEYDEFLDQLRKVILLIHPASDKYVCLCFKKNEDWQQRWVRVKDLENTLTKLWLESDFRSYDFYDSQAEYLSGGSRAISKVDSVRVSFVDIDNEYAKEYKDLSPEGWVKLIIAFCEAKKVPVPTIMVFSGNGVHVKWLYKEAVSGAQLKHWNRLEKKLCKLFSNLGADSKSSDLARVLRVSGTINYKPEMVDRAVRVVNFTSDTCNFEEFLAIIDALVPGDVEETSSESATTTLDLAINQVKEAEAFPAFYVLSETTGTLERARKHEMQDYLSRQDKTHVFRRSIAEFVGNDLKTAYKKRIYGNAVKLSASQVPGATFEEKATAIRSRCKKYREVGFPEANGITEYGDSLIVIWKYISSDNLPGRALSHWKRTQEDLCEYFADWGAKDDPKYQEVTELLPVVGLTGDTKGISLSNARYKFDDLASKMLPYTQEEVKDHKAEKSKVKAERDAKQPLRRKRVAKGQKTGNLGRMAERHFGNIWHLIEMRQDKRGEVEQGHREFCVFWRMNFAVKSGRVTNLAEFDALTQMLIDKNGLQFRSECSVSKLTTLRGRFARGRGRIQSRNSYADGGFRNNS